MLQALYDQLGLQNEGVTLDQFTSDIDGNEEAQQAVFNKLGLTEKGVSFDQFKQDLTGGVAVSEDTRRLQLGSLEQEDLDLFLTDEEEHQLDLQRIQQQADDDHRSGETGGPSGWFKRRALKVAERLGMGAKQDLVTIGEIMADKLGADDLADKFSNVRKETIKSRQRLEAHIPSKYKKTTAAQFVDTEFRGQPIEVETNPDGSFRRARDLEGYNVQVTPDFIDEFEASDVAEAREREIDIPSLMTTAEGTLYDLGILILGSKGAGALAKGAAKGLSKAAARKVVNGTVRTTVAGLAGLQTVGENYEENLREFDGDIDKAANVALTQSAITAAITSLFPTIESAGILKTPAARDAITRAALDTGKRSIFDRAIDVVRQIGGEIVEENADNILSNYAGILNGAEGAVTSVEEVVATTLISAFVSAPVAISNNLGAVSTDNLVMQGLYQASKDQDGRARFEEALGQSGLSEEEKTQKRELVQQIGDNMEVADLSDEEGLALTALMVNRNKLDSRNTNNLRPELKARLDGAIQEIDAEISNILQPPVEEAPDLEAVLDDEFGPTPTTINPPPPAAPAFERREPGRLEGEPLVPGNPQHTIRKGDEEQAFREKQAEKKAGTKMFNEPVKEARDISNEYKRRNGLPIEDNGIITSLDKDHQKAIADEFEAMEHRPNDPDVQAAYEAMAEETLAQYELMKEKGIVFELYEGEGEPYASSEEMIADVRDNKHLYVLSTEKAFENTPITDEQRASSLMLRDSGQADVNGNALLVNDVFRGVHDYFGHAVRGNSFGAIGEENAWAEHLTMFSPLAARAMTTETRGQNSWVNFGPNMRGEDGSLVFSLGYDFDSDVSIPADRSTPAPVPQEAPSTTSKDLAAVENEMAEQSDVITTAVNNAVAEVGRDLRGRALSEFNRAVDNNAFIQRLDEIFGDNVKSKAKAIGKAFGERARLPKGVKEAVEAQLGESFSTTARKIRQMEESRVALGRKSAAELNAKKQTNAKLESAVEAEFTDNISPKTVANVQNALKSIDPEITIVVHQTQESYNEATDGVGNGEWNPESKTIHINGIKASDKVVFHEAAHVVFTRLFGNSPQKLVRWAEGITSVLESGTLAERALVKKLNAFSAKYTEAHARAANLTEKQLQAEEFFAEMVGVLADSRTQITKKNRSRIADVIRNIVRDVFGIDLFPTDNFNEVIDLMNSIAEGLGRGSLDIAKDGTLEPPVEPPVTKLPSEDLFEGGAVYEINGLYGTAVESSFLDNEGIPGVQYQAKYNQGSYAPVRIAMTEQQKNMQTKSHPDYSIDFHDKVKALARDARSKDAVVIMDIRRQPGTKKSLVGDALKGLFGAGRGRGGAREARGTINFARENRMRAEAQALAEREDISFMEAWDRLTASQGKRYSVGEGNYVVEDHGDYQTIDVSDRVSVSNNTGLAYAVPHYTQTAAQNLYVGGRLIKGTEEATPEDLEDEYFTAHTWDDNLSKFQQNIEEVSAIAEFYGLEQEYQPHLQAIQTSIDNRDAASLMSAVKSMMDAEVDEGFAQKARDIGAWESLGLSGKPDSNFHDGHIGKRYSLEDLEGTEKIRPGNNLPVGLSNNNTSYLDVNPDFDSLNTIRNSNPAINSKYIGQAARFASGVIEVSNKPNTHPLNQINLFTGEIEDIPVDIVTPYYEPKLAAELDKTITNHKRVKGNSASARAKKNRLRDKALAISDQIYNKVKDALKINIRALYGLQSPELITRGRRWYEGANRIAGKLADTYGLTLEAAAAIIAVQSPQNAWQNNISAGQRLIDVMENYGDTPVTSVMIDRAFEIARGEPFADIVQGMREYEGMTINEAVEEAVTDYNNDKSLKIDNVAWKPAALLRIVDMSQNSTDVQAVAPEGFVTGVMHKDGVLDRFAWGANSEIFKAMNVFANPTPKNISAMLGRGNKVRNFYNNIVDPFSDKGYTTIDTHAIAAGLLNAVSAQGAADAGLFSTAADGNSMVYAAVKESYGEVANELGIYPREVQSVVWETIRRMLPDSVKRNPLTKRFINETWQKVQKGEITHGEAVKNIIDRFPLARPEWDVDADPGSGTQSLEGTEGVADARTRDGVNVRRQQRTTGSDSARLGQISTRRKSLEDTTADKARNVLRKVPNADPKALAAMLRKRGVNVTEAEIQVIKDQLIAEAQANRPRRRTSNYKQRSGIDDAGMSEDGALNLKTSDINEIREYFDMEATQASPKTTAALIDEARQFMSTPKEGYAREAKVIHEVLNTDAIFNVDAKMIAIRRMIDHLQKTLDSEIEVWERIKSPIERRRAEQRIHIVRTDLHHATLAYNKIGTLGGRILRFRQEQIKSDYYSESHLTELMEQAKGGQDLTPGERVFIKRKSRNLTALQNEIDKLRNENALSSATALRAFAAKQVAKMNKRATSTVGKVKTKVKNVVRKTRAPRTASAATRLRKTLDNGPC